MSEICSPYSIVGFQRHRSSWAQVTQAQILVWTFCSHIPQEDTKLFTWNTSPPTCIVSLKSLSMLDPNPPYPWFHFSLPSILISFYNALTHLFPLFYCYCSSLAYSYQSVTPNAKGIVLNNSWITRIELYRASRWTSEAASGILPSIAIHFLSFHLKKNMLKVVSIRPRPQSYLT